MRNVLLSIMTVLLVLFIFGCASPHKITLKDGTVMQTKNKPDFDKHEEFYKFKDDSGKRVSLNKDEVRKIEKMGKQ